jgi:hypothetical protein
MSWLCSQSAVDWGPARGSPHPAQVDIDFLSVPAAAGVRGRQPGGGKNKSIDFAQKEVVGNHLLAAAREFHVGFRLISAVKVVRQSGQVATTAPGTPAPAAASDRYGENQFALSR